MYGLLIVDDEYQARGGIRDLIDWEAINIQVLGDADDGDVALPMLHALRPDILITDIRMHRMDGLTLARHARQCLPDIQIVFISGYSDADYLRQALRIEAFDYLYKPVRLRELQALMVKLVARLDARAEARAQMEHSRILLEKSRPLLMERFMHSWIHGMLEDTHAMQARLDLLGLTIPQGGMVALAFQPEWPTFPSDGQAEAYLLLLENMVGETFSQAMIATQDTGLIGLIPCTTHQDIATHLTSCKGIIDKLQGVTDGVLLAGVSAWQPSWDEVPTAVRQAQQALERQITQNDDEVFVYDEADGGASGTITRFDGDDLIERHLIVGNFDALWTGIENMLTELDGAGSDGHISRKLLIACALRADLIMEQRGLPGIDSLSFCRHAIAHRTLSPIKGSLQSALRQACNHVRNQQQNAYSAAITRVLSIIHTRYGENLSVSALAEDVHYSAAHLSTLFRQETGTTIGDVLFRTRLSAAMEQLRTTQDPVCLIAQSTGYTDVQYFSRVFKRFTGMTPLEYRKRVLSC